MVVEATSQGTAMKTDVCKLLSIEKSLRINEQRMNENEYNGL